MSENISFILSEGKRVPVWFMRQAGRHMPKFREIVGKKWITDVVREPELAAEVAAEPVFSLGVDASIIFMDITTPFELLGFNFKFAEGKGPVYADKLDKLYNEQPEYSFDEWEPIREQIKLLKKMKLKVIGFEAGPFTLMTYFLNDDHRDRIKTKDFLKDKMQEKLSPLMQVLLQQAKFQFKSGSDGFQIFDSWAGSLSGEMLEAYIEVLKIMFDELKNYKKRLIYFCRNCNALLYKLVNINYDGYLSIDWNCDPKVIFNRFKGNVGLQGNLDPFYAYVGGDFMLNEAKKVLKSIPDYSKYVFNLGHGILPGTSVENLKLLTDYVKNWNI
ncbi:MAG: uroporphyrinogen decarboxylase family protein [Nitrososphaeria archaeon]|nr:uroporphyrinogen decarboxylase family protein [Conexivisphaerales archaeon]